MVPGGGVHFAGGGSFGNLGPFRPFRTRLRNTQNTRNMKFSRECPWCKRPQQVRGYALGRHPVVEVSYKRERLAVDQGVAPLLQSLWKSKIATSESCQNQAGHPGAISVTFPNSTEAEKFMRHILHRAPRALADRALGGWIWVVRTLDMENSGRFEVRVVFPRKDLPVIIRSFKVRKKA